jgi:ATP-binding cassette, subfamily B, bacterial
MADAAEDIFIEETERLLAEAGNSSSDQSDHGNEELPAQPFRFVLHFVRYYKWLLLGIVCCEFGQAACQILIPKAVQRIIDAASALNQPGGSVWTTLAGPMRFFLLLNIGILIFSRSSGSMLIIV